MKYCLFAMLVIQISVFSGTLQQIQNDKETSRITSSQALFYEALLAYAPDQLPSIYQDAGIEPVKCGFGSRSELRQSWHLLSEEEQSILKPFMARPSYSHKYYTPSGLFCLHYSDSGSASVPLEDLDNNGIPDFVEEGGKALDLAYQIIIEQMGFHEPPRDTIDGSAWDVYFKSYNGYGETVPEGSAPPHISYILLDNDFNEVETKGLDGLRVTCAHEFFHMVQVGYQYRYDDVFLMEASATWMEDVVYDHINDYLNYLDEIFGRENVAFNSRDGLHEYGLCVWFQFLSERYGRIIVRDIWEYLIDYPALNACDMALGLYGIQLNDEIAEFYGWNLMTGSRADTLRFYPEGHLYPEQMISEKIDLSENYVLRKSVQKTAARYFEASLDNQTTIIWAMVNANWESSQYQSDGMLQIQLNDADSYFNTITDSVFSLLISDQGAGWRYSVMVQEPNENITLNVYPEFSELQFATISGRVWIYQESEGELFKSGILPGVTVGCLSAGEDSCFYTEDDKVFANKQTTMEGLYEFFGLPDGLYRITLEETGVPDPYVTVDGVLTIDAIIENSEDIANADFGFWSVEENNFPASIPNPYVLNTWPDMKIPFSLVESGVVTLTVFSSQGFKVYQPEEKYFDTEGASYFRWDGRVNEESLPSGIYLYVIVCNKKVIRQEKIAIIH